MTEPVVARRVAIVAGVCTRHDAISNVVRLEEEALVGAGYDVRVFTHHTDFPSDSHVVVTDPWILQRNHWYRSADMVILHFGIQYGLFNSLLLEHPGHRVVRFHNVTPPELLCGAARRQAHAGIEQASIIERADSVWADSQFNARCLLQWSDVDPERVDVFQLCAPWESTAGPGGRGTEPVPGQPEHVISVGRLVPAKGQHDLIAAVALLSEETRERLRVRLIGSAGHSDPEYIERLVVLVDALGLSEVVSFELDLDDDALCGEYERASVLVSTSRHEGFCVPVLEALGAGCRVVVTDAGALRETVGVCGDVVPVGDLRELSRALDRALEQAGDRTSSMESLVGCAEHLHGLSRSAFSERLIARVADLVDQGGPDQALSR